MKNNKSLLFFYQLTFIIKTLFFIGIILSSGAIIQSCAIEERDKGIGELVLNLQSDAEVHIVSRAETVARELIPDASEFTIRMYNQEGTYDKTYAKYSDISQPLYLPVGNYQIEAQYGDNNKEGFDSPVYGGKSEFIISEGKNTSVDLTCYLTNVKVSLNVAEVFTKYFKEYSITIKSANNTSFVYKKGNEHKFLYLDPGELKMEISVTKQNGVSSTYEPVSISNTKAREHYIFNLNVNSGNVGGEQLTITFNSETESNPIAIDLTDESMNVKAPFFTLTGFESGVTRNISEGSDIGEVSVLINARGKFKSLILNIESTYLTNMASCPFTADIVGIQTKDSYPLQQVGFEWTSSLVMAGESDSELQMAVLDFSKVIPQLRIIGEDNEHKITMYAIDKNSKKSEEVELIIKTLDGGFILGRPDSVLIGSDYAVFPIELLEGNINQVKIKYKDDYGNWKEATSHEVISSENDTYMLKAGLPISNKNLTVKATYNTLESNEEVVNVFAPEFILEVEDYDVWATKVYVKVIPDKEEEINSIFRFLSIEIGETENWSEKQYILDNEKNRVLIKGLLPNNNYKIRAYCLDNHYSNEELFVTESALQLEGSDFNNNWESILIENVPKGGRTINRLGRYSPAPIVTVESFDLNGYWATTNPKTAYPNANPPNTWYIVPSVIRSSIHEDNYSVLLRNVSWHQQGDAVKDNTVNILNSTGTPTPPTVFHRSAGVLFLGDYSFDGEVQTYDMGIPFECRPTGISINYKYTLKSSDLDDKGLIMVQILDEENNLLLNTEEQLSAIEDYENKKILLNYDILDKKASRIILLISSSHNWSIYQEEEDNKIKTTNDLTNLISVGSELYIDDIQLNYD